jgi:hypothetical protein
MNRERNRAKEKCLKEIFGANNKMHFWPEKENFVRISVKRNQDHSKNKDRGSDL